MVDLSIPVYPVALPLVHIGHALNVPEQSGQIADDKNPFEYVLMQRGRNSKRRKSAKQRAEAC